MELADYIRSIDPKAYFSSFHIFTPFPGTELFQSAIDKYSFIPPAKLEDWYNFRVNAINVPWISKENKIKYLNLCLITYFMDGRFPERTKNTTLKIFTRLLKKRALYYWQKKQFKNCPEFQLLGWLENWNLNRKINRIRIEDAC